VTKLDPKAEPEAQGNPIGPIAFGMIWLMLLVPATLVLVMAYHGTGWPGLDVTGFIFVVATGPMVVLAAIGLLRHWGLTGPTVLPWVLVGAAYAGLLAYFICIRGNDHQRCVETSDLTVVSSSFCGTDIPPGGVGPYAWYYGGSGTRVGDQVTSGSFTNPEDGDEGTNGGKGGDDGTNGGKGSGGGDEGGEGGEGGGEGGGGGAGGE
jgi:hypothetical protein